MLRDRLKTAAVLIVVAAFVLYFGGLLLLLAGLVVFVAVNAEYFKFAVPLSRDLRAANCIATLMLPAGYLLAGWPGWGIAVQLFLLFMFSELVIVVETRRHAVTLSEFVPAMLLGAAYTGILGSVLVIVAGSPDAARKVTWLLSVVVFSDSLAYFIGRSLSTPRFAPRISPNKTWGGAIGGLAGAVIGGALVFLELELAGGSVLWAVVMSGAAGVLCQIGDLVESMIKRAYRVKDSGTLLPGHGGVLDRVDGLMFAAPLIVFAPW